jgi:hypothetical protein
MAPPLLPVTRLTPCVACGEHVRAGEHACPHCGASLAGAGWARAAGVLVAGVMLTSCGEDKPDDDPTIVQSAYGSPETDNSAGDPTGPTESPEPTTSTVPTGTTTDTTSNPSEPLYGSVTVGSDTDTDTGTTTDPSTGSDTTDTGTTADTETVGEPDYGVPGTTGTT